MGGPEFEGIIDLVKMELVTYGDDLGTAIEKGPLPESLVERAEAARAEMIEKIAETDGAHRKIPDGRQAITNEELVTALRNATIRG